MATNPKTNYHNGCPSPFSCIADTRHWLIFCDITLVQLPRLPPRRSPREINNITMVDGGKDYAEVQSLNGERIAGILLGLVILVWLLYSIQQAHHGRGRGNFFKRFIRNLFSCCTMAPVEVAQKADEVAGNDVGDGMSMRSRKISRVSHNEHEGEASIGVVEAHNRAEGLSDEEIRERDQQGGNSRSLNTI
jgi:hypothetical protein